MYSRNHALLSALIGVPIAINSPSYHPVIIWIYVVVIGVGIDIDHFVVARFNRGDWKNARRCLQNPSLIFVSQQAIFDSGDLWRDQRLLSHLIIGGMLTTSFLMIDLYWALGTGMTVYIHILSDLYADNQSREAYLSKKIA